MLMRLFGGAVFGGTELYHKFFEIFEAVKENSSISF